MAMTIIWTGMVVLSVLCGLATGRGPAVAAAAMEGAVAGVELCLSMAGVLCLWMGVMEVMKRSGLSDKLSRLLMPVLRRLYPAFARDREVMDTISANVSANLLGLGNAATPFGIRAAQLLAGQGADGLRGLLVLLVINNSGLELMPSAVMTLRQQAGSVAPGAIWLPTLAATGISTLVAVMLLYWTDRREKRG